VRIDPSRANFRKLHPFQVNLRPDQLAQAGGAAVQLDPRLDLLVWHGAYNPALGLSPDQADALLVV
jgi:hypothetical protein